MKHLKAQQKYSIVCHILNSLLSVSSGDEALHLMLDILHSSTKDNFSWEPKTINVKFHQNIVKTDVRCHFMNLTFIFSGYH